MPYLRFIDNVGGRRDMVDVSTETPLPASTPSDPSRGNFAVAPSDTVNFTTPARSLYIGGAGNVVVVAPDASVVTFVGVPVGTILPVQATRVNLTGTTATNIVGLI